MISGQQTEARLGWERMMYIADRRLSGDSPLRPGLGPEYALAILWAEAALSRAGEVEQRERIERFLNSARLEHNNRWVSPSGSGWE